MKLKSNFFTLGDFFKNEVSKLINGPSPNKEEPDEGPLDDKLLALSWYMIFLIPRKPSDLKVIEDTIKVKKHKKTPPSTNSP